MRTVLGRLRSVVLNVSLVLGAIGALVLLLCLVLHIRPVVMTSGSMTPEISQGALVLTRTTTVTDLQIGDVVTVAGDPGEGLVTHRITAINGGDSEKTRALTLKGDANAAEDPSPYVVPKADKAVTSIPALGSIADIVMKNAVVFVGLWLVLLVLAMLGKPSRSAGTARELDDARRRIRQLESQAADQARPAMAPVPHMTPSGDMTPGGHMAPSGHVPRGHMTPAGASSGLVGTAAPASAGTSRFTPATGAVPPAGFNSSGPAGLTPASGPVAATRLPWETDEADEETQIQVRPAGLTHSLPDAAAEPPRTLPLRGGQFGSEPAPGTLDPEPAHPSAEFFAPEAAQNAVDEDMGDFGETVIRRPDDVEPLDLRGFTGRPAPATVPEEAPAPISGAVPALAPETGPVTFVSASGAPAEPAHVPAAVFAPIHEALAPVHDTVDHPARMAQPAQPVLPAQPAQPALAPAAAYAPAQEPFEAQVAAPVPGLIDSVPLTFGSGATSSGAAGSRYTVGAPSTEASGAQGYGQYANRSAAQQVSVAPQAQHAPAPTASASASRAGQVPQHAADTTPFEETVIRPLGAPRQPAKLAAPQHPQPGSEGGDWGDYLSQNQYDDSVIDESTVIGGAGMPRPRTTHKSPLAWNEEATQEMTFPGLVAEPLPQAARRDQYMFPQRSAAGPVPRH